MHNVNIPLFTWRKCVESRKKWCREVGRAYARLSVFAPFLAEIIMQGGEKAEKAKKILGYQGPSFWANVSFNELEAMLNASKGEMDTVLSSEVISPPMRADEVINAVDMSRQQ